VFPSTLEGCVVRVSDIISYLGKDMEDAIAIGLIKRTDIPCKCAHVLGRRNTEIIGTLCTDIVKHSFGKGRLEFSPEVFDAYKTMKAFNGERIYGCGLLAEQRGKFAKMMAALFEVYLEAVEQDDQRCGVCRDYLRHFPSSYRDETPPARIVADYLSLMTDQYFLKQYEREFMPRTIDYDR
jgi:dGTPase